MVGSMDGGVIGSGENPVAPVDQEVGGWYPFGPAEDPMQ